LQNNKQKKKKIKENKRAPKKQNQRWAPTLRVPASVTTQKKTDKKKPLPRKTPHPRLTPGRDNKTQKKT